MLLLINIYNYLQLYVSVFACMWSDKPSVNASVVYSTLSGVVLVAGDKGASGADSFSPTRLPPQAIHLLCTHTYISIHFVLPFCYTIITSSLCTFYKRLWVYLINVGVQILLFYIIFSMLRVSSTSVLHRCSVTLLISIIILSIFQYALNIHKEFTEM